MRIVNFVLSFSLFIALSSCASSIVSFEYRGADLVQGKKVLYEAVPIDSVLVRASGIKIIAMDNSFSMESGMAIPTPFSVNSTYFFNEIGNDYQSALEAGSKRVRVVVDGQEKALYGVLFFGVLPFPVVTTNPSLDKYYIDGLQEAINNAYNGHISHVGNKVIFENNIWYNNGRPVTNIYSHILWLSLKPFLT